MTTDKQGVQRYTDMGSETICPINNMRKSDDGDYVLYEDYETLQAENAQLHAAIRRVCNIYVIDDYYDGQQREERLEAAVHRAINAAKEEGK